MEKSILSATSEIGVDFPKCVLPERMMKIWEDYTLAFENNIDCDQSESQFKMDFSSFEPMMFSIIGVTDPEKPIYEQLLYNIQVKFYEKDSRRCELSAIELSCLYQQRACVEMFFSEELSSYSLNKAMNRERWSFPNIEKFEEITKEWMRVCDQVSDLLKSRENQQLLLKSPQDCSEEDFDSL